MASFQEFKDKAISGLVAFTVGMMWYDIREMRNDVKQLLTETANNKARIENLERSLFNKPSSDLPKSPNSKNYVYFDKAAILRDNDIHIEQENDKS